MADINSLEIREIAMRLAKTVEAFKKRYFLLRVLVGKEPRIKVLRGFRGLGKTTSLLQLFGSSHSIYFSMDNPYVQLHSIYALGKKLVMEGHNVLLIDEAHHYKNWKMDTKALYDEFPGLTIIISGSAPLAFEPERRYEIIEVEPLSILEFSELKGDLINVQDKDAWLSVDKTLEIIAANPKIYEVYTAYMNGGAFPTFFSYNEKTLESIFNSIQKSVSEDAVFLQNVDGDLILQMGRALVFLATSKLGEFSINSLAGTLGIPKNKAYHLVHILELMRILRLVKPYGRGAKLVRGDPKLMFYHPVMRKAVCRSLGLEADTGAIREELAVFFFRLRGWRISTIKGMKKSPDYIIERGREKLIVEIGGISKGRSQLKGFSEKTVVLSERQLIVLGLF
ncbi:TPA: ATP-binding protein [Candidatus Micrarchaeota archaeon]|nr:ATP-binding protein [Candidatus Micrarchaeota archaeon]